jgi:hypothetical protein
MSQYLNFELVYKENPEIKVDLGYWCTSIARSIYYNFDNVFSYTENDIILTVGDMETYIDRIHTGIEKYKKYLQKEVENKRENTELLIRAQTSVAMEAIREDITNNDESIAAWEDEIETWINVETELNFILEIYKENIEGWDLIYRNA